jgi:hypothetical protein
MLRSRLASFLLLLASPAVGGTVMPVAHPCLVDAPWLAQTPEAGGGHQGHHQAQSPDQSDHTCTCPSACAAATVVAAPAVSASVGLPEAPVRSRFTELEVSAPWARSLLERLPPSTAPPIA